MAHSPNGRGPNPEPYFQRVPTGRDDADPRSQERRDGDPDEVGARLHPQSAARRAAGGITPGRRGRRSDHGTRVASGETFATIAQLYYGSARYDKALQWANRGLTARPERLTVGDLIVIPASTSSMPRRSVP